MIEHGIIRGADDLRLVHGVVTGQGKLEGVRFGHAWIERGNTVYDHSNGRDIEMSKDAHYKLGHIEDAPGKLYRYTPEQTRQKMLEFEHFGPWDLETDL